MQGRRVLLAVAGSVAAYKAVELLRRFTSEGATVQVAMTSAACRFVGPLLFESLSGLPVLTDLFTEGGTQIQHVERAHEVDLIVVAPATANTLAKLAHGLADDQVSAIALSSRAPLVVAPAMETGMWTHPATAHNMSLLQERGVSVVGPGAGALASGRQGLGRLAELEDIVVAARRALGSAQRWRGRRVVITAGPTEEPIDPVRVLSNRATGAMGLALARAFVRHGAEVDVILGPTHLAAPDAARTRRVQTAEQMLEATRACAPGCDLFIATAAVSDFRPANPHAQKLKRSRAEASQLELVENPDILRTIASELQGSGAVIVGFAAETENLVANAQDKRERKGCDLVVANVVGPDRGFGPGQTSIVVVRRDEIQRFGPSTKDGVADFLLETLDQLVGVRTVQDDD